MRRQRLTQEQRRAATREALLTAAIEVFADRGYEGASVEELADAAGFTKGAVYSNFGGKDDLFLAVVERHYQVVLDAYAELIDAAANGPVSTSAVANVWREVEGRDQLNLRLLLEFRLQALRRPEIAERLRAFEDETERIIAAFIAAQTERAGVKLRLPAQEFATVLYAANQGLLIHAAIHQDDQDALFERFLQLVTASAIDPGRHLGETGDSVATSKER